MARKILNWLGSRPKRWEHLKGVPLIHTAPLLLAIFLLFSVLGFDNDLMDGGTEPYLVALASAIFGGLLPVGAFPARELLMYSGDLLLVATDGIIEVCSKKDVEFGIEALESLLVEQAERPLPEIAASILAAILLHGKQQDDQTLLLVRRLPA